MSSAVPWINQISVQVSSSTQTCIELQAPTRGYLNRLIVTQVSGPTDGFSYDVYDREDACESVSTDSVTPEDTVELLDPIVHKITPTKTVSASGSTGEDFEKSWYYENQDERQSPSRRLKGAIWLSLRPEGSEDKTFHIAYTIANPL